MLGDEHAAGDLLKVAHLMVSAYEDPLDELAEFGVARSGGRPFETLPVDEAMNDGGWRVLRFEWKRHSSCADRRDPIQMVRLNRVLRSYLGPEWRHHDWIGNGLSPID